MLSFPPAVRIWLATNPTDLRKSFDTLAELVRRHLQQDPLSGHVFVFVNKRGRIGTQTNRSGGVQGGISNGEEIVFRVAFKPTATILQAQRTVDLRGAGTELKARGRHDPCVVPRAVVIVEAMAALVLVDHWMRQVAQNGSFKF